jgi:hypothetical protein
MTTPDLESRMSDIAMFPSSLRKAGLPILAVPALAAALLAGCGRNASEKFAPACPVLKLLPDAADLVRTRGQGTDITDLVVRGRITNVPAHCKDGGRGAVAADMQVGFDITRGPAGNDSSITLPYLVTIMLGDRILDQKPFTVTATFPPNVDQVNVTGDTIDLDFPVSPDRQASDYTIYVSFRLTQAELAANRRSRH